MDRRELGNDSVESLMAAMQGWQASIWTAMPGKVLSFDSSDNTCSVQVTIQMSRQLPSGDSEWVSISPLIKCPLVFMNGGGAVLTFPVKEGDEALVVFASRCIDGWWQTGDISPQAEFRMHDISDGFVVVGPRSAAKAVGAWSSDRVELRTEDSSAVISLDTTSGDVEVTSSANITLTAPNIIFNGNIQHTGSFVSNGKNVGSNHTHGGVRQGTETSGGPS